VISEVSNDEMVAGGKVPVLDGEIVAGGEVCVATAELLQPKCPDP